MISAGWETVQAHPSPIISTIAPTVDASLSLAVLSTPSRPPISLSLLIPAWRCIGPGRSRRGVLDADVSTGSPSSDGFPGARVYDHGWTTWCSYGWLRSQCLVVDRFGADSQR